MATFSQRYGHASLENAIQRESLDEALRNTIWNHLKIVVFDRWGKGHVRDGRASGSDFVEHLCTHVWVHFIKIPLENMPSRNPRSRTTVYQVFQDVILQRKWHHALDLLEFIVRYLQINSTIRDELIKQCNDAFENENSAYRFVGFEITEITSLVEIESIETGLNNPTQSIKSHLEQALSLLSDRTSPDYRNSMKESISAVEAISKLISGNTKGSLGECLTVIRKKHQIPPALEKSLQTLYGYTSNDGGIRHALTDETEHPTFADAKFLLVSCTAFINYLWTIAAEKDISVD